MGDETQPPSDVANGAFLSTRMAPRRPGKSWPIMQTLCTVVALPIYRSRLRAVRLHLLASVIGSISHFTDQPSPVNSAPGFSIYPQLGRASCRERVWQYVSIWVGEE